MRWPVYRTRIAAVPRHACCTDAVRHCILQAAGDSGTRESIDDLYSIRLRETVGQGGQGVVFRGLMHSLEVAVKVSWSVG